MSKDKVTEKGAVSIDEDALDAASGGIVAGPGGNGHIKLAPPADDETRKKSIGNVKY